MACDGNEPDQDQPRPDGGVTDETTGYRPALGPQTAMTPFRHILYDVWLEDAQILERVEPMREMMLEAARRSNALILDSYFHQFDPHGVTGVVLIAQSHLSIHTWSEDAYAAIDLFTYSHMDPDAAINYIREQLRPVRERLSDLTRGGAP